MTSPENLGKQFDAVKMTPMMKKVHAHISEVANGFSRRLPEGEIVDGMGGYLNSRKEIPILDALSALRQSGHIKHSDDLPEEHMVEGGKVWAPVEGESTDRAAELRARYGG
jgi:hypothetical protein